MTGKVFEQIRHEYYDCTVVEELHNIIAVRFHEGPEKSYRPIIWYEREEFLKIYKPKFPETKE